MRVNKYFKELNIEPILELDVREKCEFANKVAVVIMDKFKDNNLDYLKIVDILQHTEMYIAKIPKHLSPVNYSYLDGKMYISEDIALDVNNEFVLHEFIHRIQEYRNKKEKLIQLGLCDVMETKIKGLALNEAAIQYLVQKILNGKNEIIDVYGMKIHTISKNYYPILTNLIQQIVFLVGEDKLVDSTFNSNNEFKYNTIDILGEDTYNAIENSFEKILEAKNNILKNKNQNIIEENSSFIKKTYIDIQNKIMTSYFNSEFKRIKNVEQLKDFSAKLLEYRNLIGTEEGQVLYSDYYNDMLQKIEDKEKNLLNKALVVVKENKILNIFRNVKNYISKLIFQD